MASRLHQVSYVALIAGVGLFSLATPARAQSFDTGSVSFEAAALSAAAKANPKLAKDLAKELGSTPEQAAGAAGVIFGIAKSFLKPEEFAKISKAVPGMNALLAAAPSEAVGTSGDFGAIAPATFTPGFSSGASATTPELAMAAASNPMTSAIGGLSKLGIKPEMFMKAIPFLTEYLKKYGGAAVGGLLGGVFKTPGK